MTEEIIIDGVNVAGCKFYKETLQAYKDGTISSFKGYGFCTHNIKGLNNAGCYAEDFARCLKNDCYYKQLKRLEQERDGLKENKTYRSALEEIRKIEELAYYSKGVSEESLSQRDFMLNVIDDYEQRRINILTKINEIL